MSENEAELRSALNQGTSLGVCRVRSSFRSSGYSPGQSKQCSPSRGSLSIDLHFAVSETEAKLEVWDYGTGIDLELLREFEQTGGRRGHRTCRHARAIARTESDEHGTLIRALIPVSTSSGAKKSAAVAIEDRAHMRDVGPSIQGLRRILTYVGANIKFEEEPKAGARALSAIQRVSASTSPAVKRVLITPQEPLTILLLVLVLGAEAFPVPMVAIFIRVVFFWAEVLLLAEILPAGT